MTESPELQTLGKSSQLNFVVAISSGDFFRDIFEDYYPHQRRKLRRRQHAIDDGRRETGGLMISSQKGPGGAARNAKRLCLLVECRNSRSDESVAKLPDFGCLSSLHLCEFPASINTRLSRIARPREVIRRRLGTEPTHFPSVCRSVLVAHSLSSSRAPIAHHHEARLTGP